MSYCLLIGITAEMFQRINLSKADVINDFSKDFIAGNRISFNF